ncbi:MAG: iron-sulfur cluster insertion protein ErpA [Minisyncoccia bacterium]
MILLTEEAKHQLENIVLGYNYPNLMVRMYVSGGGCNGMQYGFELTDIKEIDDFEFPANKVRLIVDPISLQYIEGITVDYKNDLTGAHFVMKNPKASKTCGCGNSFNPY